MFRRKPRPKVDADWFQVHVYSDIRRDGTMDDNTILWIGYAISEEQLLRIRDILEEGQVETL